MPITDVESEYKRLRSYLNPAIRGKTVDAVLYAIASGSSSYLVNTVNAVNDNLYIATAVGQYLDLRLSEYGITRPPSVGLSDDIFREIGLEVKNRKQVRDLINNLLYIIFGDEASKASSKSQGTEPYSLADGDTLIVNFDGSYTVTIPFSASNFQNIAAATAIEVADVISAYLNTNNLGGKAIVKSNGVNSYVEIISGTIGPASSVTVFGGRAQNALLFSEPAPAGGNMSTQWTLTVQPGGKIRFTWSGGADPQLGKVEVDNYVNVYGGGFASSTNVGSFTILKSVGGAINDSYFEIYNPLGTSGIITQGADDAVLFYVPIKKTLASNFSYASVYQTESRILQIFLPASTKVVRRYREGSAHLHDPPRGNYVFNVQPNNGDFFQITTSYGIIAGVNFAIGATILDTCNNMANFINTLPGLFAIVNDDNIVAIQNDSLSNTIVCSYTGAVDIVASGPLGDQKSLEPDQPGPYIYDLTQPFTISNVGTKNTQLITPNGNKLIQVQDSSNIPDATGYLIFGYGTSSQEGPVPYIARPSNNTLLVSPVYNIKNRHAIGTDIRLVSKKAPVSPSADGSDYEFFITDTISGRQYAEDLIKSIAATGISVVFTVLLPNDIGLGKWGTEYTENPIIWGA